MKEYVLLGAILIVILFGTYFNYGAESARTITPYVIGSGVAVVGLSRGFKLVWKKKKEVA